MKTQLFLAVVFLCSVSFGCDNTLQKEHDGLLKELKTQSKENERIVGLANSLKDIVMRTDTNIYSRDESQREARRLDSLRKIVVQKNMAFLEKWNIHTEKHRCE